VNQWFRRLQRESETGPFVFVSERGAPFTTAGFARMMERAAKTAGLKPKVHPKARAKSVEFGTGFGWHCTSSVQASAT
jgi:hypothetical protein